MTNSSRVTDKRSLVDIFVAVVGEPVFWHHCPVVLGGVAGEHESFGEGLLPDAWAEARRPDSAALLHLQGASELIEAMASVGVVDGARAESTSGQATGGRVGWNRIPAMLAGFGLDL